MSCCGFPAKSHEPEYGLPIALEGVALEWEKRFPGAFHAIREHIGQGNWERAEGLDVPAYSLEEAFEAACVRLERYVLEQETLRIYKEGSLWVRMGLKRPPACLPEKLAQEVSECKERAMSLLQQALKATPAQLQVGQTTVSTPLIVGASSWGWGAAPRPGCASGGCS